MLVLCWVRASQLSGPLACRWPDAIIIPEIPPDETLLFVMAGISRQASCHRTRSSRERLRPAAQEILDGPLAEMAVAYSAGSRTNMISQSLRIGMVQLVGLPHRSFTAARQASHRQKGDVTSRVLRRSARRDLCSVCGLCSTAGGGLV